MLLFLFLFGLALGAVSPSDDPQVKLQRGNCPMFWYSFNGRCYKYVATHLTWADAELNCVFEGANLEGANLVAVHSLEEQNFIQSLIQNFDTAQGPTWNGLSDIHKEGKWMWSDGSAVNFVFWSQGEPSNGHDNEHCAHNNYGSDKKWNDHVCSDRFPSICATRKSCS